MKAENLKRVFPWLSNPMTLVLIGLLLAFILDFLASPFITKLVFWLAGFDADISPGVKDLGTGVVFVGTTFIVFVISFPLCAWICIKRMFNLFSEKK
jgi:predicted transcriptional regulator